MDLGVPSFLTGAGESGLGAVFVLLLELITVLFGAGTGLAAGELLAGLLGVVPRAAFSSPVITELSTSSVLFVASVSCACISAVLVLKASLALLITCSTLSLKESPCHNHLVPSLVGAKVN